MAIFRRSGNPKPSNPPTRGEYRGDTDPIGAPAPPPVSVDPPENTQAPVIAGDPEVGSVLTATPGEWTGSPNVTGVWQVDGTPLPTQVNLTFVIRQEDIGKKITYKETAINVGGVVTAVSNEIEAEAAAGTPPTVDTLPSISYSGTLTIDTVITGVPGSYTGETSIARRWLRDNTVISGQTGSTYTITALDIGAEIVYREIPSNSDGSIVADSDPVIPVQPPTTGDLLQTFDMSLKPSGVSISRTGSGATYRNADGDIVEASANTPRYHYNADGSFAGLYVERSKTNQANFSKAVGDSSPSGGWTINGSGVSVTLNAAEAPNGLTQATRVQISAGTTLRGIQKGYPVTSGTLRNSLYMRSRSGSQNIFVRDPASGYVEVTLTPTWQRIDRIGVNQGGSWFNVNILSPDGAAKDFEVWGLDLCPSGASNDSLLLASGSGSVTRPAEVLSITTAHTGNKDIKIVFSDDTEQVLLNQSLPGGVFVISANNLTAGKNLVKTVEVWQLGTLTGSSPPPAPSPEPEPPPAPPPSGGVWSSEEVETAIVIATGLNEANIKGVANGTGGWKSGAALAFGNRWNNMPPKPVGWSWPEGPWPPEMYWPYVYPWGVIFNRFDNNTTEGWVELKDYEMQLLYRNASSWTRIIGKTSSIPWGEEFLPDNISSSGIQITTRPGPGGGTSIKIPNASRHPHFTCAGGGTEVTNLANIEGVLITCLVRIDPTGDPNVKALIDIACDPKPTRGGNAADGVPWYPGTQVSSCINITSQWRRVTSCNITGIAADSTQLDRTFPASRIRSVRPLA